MRTFELKAGAETLALDDAGSVSLGGNAIGTWTTNKENQIVVKKKAGGQTALDVDWLFNPSNHLVLQQDGTEVFDFNAIEPEMPELRVERAVLFVKPVSGKPFEFSLRPKWGISADHDLVMTVGGKSSEIDGVIHDPSGAFRFKFVDKADPMEQYALNFKGEWRNVEDEPGAVVYRYEIEGSAEKGEFRLPNKLAINEDTHCLAYGYSKDGKTRGVQLVGQFSFSNGELTYAIERKSGADGNSTILRFDARIGGAAGANGGGTLEFELLHNGQPAGTKLSITSKYTGRFKNGSLTLSFGFKQQTTSGTVAQREFVFAGELQHKGTSFAWAFATAGGTSAISLAASNIKLGSVTAQTQIKVALQSGEVKAVQVFVGFTVPKKLAVAHA